MKPVLLVTISMIIMTLFQGHSLRFCGYQIAYFLSGKAVLRANVTNGQTFGGNRSKINSAHILMLGRP